MPVRPVMDLVSESFADLKSFVVRLTRSLRTLVFVPGELSREHLAGRDLDHVPPFRLFVDVGVTSLLVTRLLPSDVALFGLGPVLFGEHLSLGAWLEACYTIGMAATAHWVVLRRRRPLFMGSAVFVLDVATFSFLLAPAGGALSALLGVVAPRFQLLADLLPPLALALYWVLALRRFNGSERERNAKDVLLIYGTFVLLLLPMLFTLL